MATYKFSWLNNGFEIVNPELQCNSDGIVIFVSKNEITVPITLRTDTAEFGIDLDAVQVDDFNYN